MLFLERKLFYFPFLDVTDFCNAHGDIFRQVLSLPFQYTNGVISAMQEIPFWSPFWQSDFVDGRGLSESRDHSSGCGANKYCNILVFNFRQILLFLKDTFYKLMVSCPPLLR